MQGKQVEKQARGGSRLAEIHNEDTLSDLGYVSQVLRRKLYPQARVEGLPHFSLSPPSDLQPGLLAYWANSKPGSHRANEPVIPSKKDRIKEQGQTKNQ